MKKVVSLLLALVCCACFVMPGYATDLTSAMDYNLAEKLQKQLWAGSGFQGTLTFEMIANQNIDGQTLSTKEPLVFDLSYIYARPTEVQTDEHRLDLNLMRDEKSQLELDLQLKDGALAFKTDLLGADWYTIASGPKKDQSVTPQEDTPVLSAMDEAREQLFSQTGLPSLAGQILGVLTKLPSDDLTAMNLLNAYTTKVDLWIEDYRQNAILDKLEDGTTTMQVQYDIPASAIKTQAKQLVLDILSDNEAITTIGGIVGEEYADILLDKSLQSYYFYAIDQLPLTGNMTISRTVALTGDTIELHLSMPMHDAQAGSVTLNYDRTAGQGDLPDDHKVSIRNDDREITLAYLEYRTMTDTTVWQGTFTSIPATARGFAVGDEEDADKGLGEKILSVAFILKQESTTSKDDDNRDVLDYLVTLTLAPDEENTFEEEVAYFKQTEVELKARFVSKELKKAATEMDASLTVGGEEWAQTFSLKLNGKSRSKWDLAVLPMERVDLGTMKQSELDTLLLSASAKAGVLLLDYITMNASPDVTEAPEESQAPKASDMPSSTDAPSSGGTKTPAQTDTAAPTGTPAPSGSGTPSATGTPAPTKTPTATNSPAPSGTPALTKEPSVSSSPENTPAS